MSDPDGLSPEARLLYADLKRAADELAYLNTPVECRTSQHGLSWLRRVFGRTPVQPHPEVKLSSLISGLRVIVDPELPENRIEFRDRDGRVTYSIDL